MLAITGNGDYPCVTMTPFAEKLRVLLAAKRVSQKRLASSLGISKSTLNDYLTEKSKPQIDTALKLARALQVPLEWLADDCLDYPPPGRELVPTTMDITHLARVVADPRDGRGRRKPPA